MTNIYSNRSNDNMSSTDCNTDEKWFEKLRDKTIPERVRCCRKHFHWSQEKAAEYVGLSVTAYGQFERGKTKAKLENLRKFETAFGVPEGFLYAKAKATPDNSQIKSEKKALLIKKIKEKNLSIEQYDLLIGMVSEFMKLSS